MQKLISSKKKAFFEYTVVDSIGKSKELWKALKSLKLLCLPSKTSVHGTKALKVNNTVSFESKSILDVYYTIL